MGTLYVETSVVSYLAARPSRDVVTEARRVLTVEWWTTRRLDHALYVSPVVVMECRRGDPEAAARRSELLSGLPVLALNDAALKLAHVFLRESALPPAALDDATHVALAAVHKMQYFLTWNCRHIANPRTRPLLRSVCAVLGHTCPEICTPQDLLEQTDNG